AGIGIVVDDQDSLAHGSTLSGGLGSRQPRTPTTGNSTIARAQVAFLPAGSRLPNTLAMAHASITRISRTIVRRMDASISGPVDRKRAISEPCRPSAAGCAWQARPGAHELELVEARVQSAAFEQLGMRALLAQLAVVEHE